MGSAAVTMTAGTAAVMKHRGAAGLLKANGHHDAATPGTPVSRHHINVHRTQTPRTVIAHHRSAQRHFISTESTIERFIHPYGVATLS